MKKQGEELDSALPYVTGSPSKIEGVAERSEVGGV